MRSKLLNRETRTWIVLGLTFAALLALLINAIALTEGASTADELHSTLAR